MNAFILLKYRYHGEKSFSIKDVPVLQTTLFHEGDIILFYGNYITADDAIIQIVTGYFQIQKKEIQNKKADKCTLSFTSTDKLVIENATNNGKLPGYMTFCFNDLSIKSLTLTHKNECEQYHWDYKFFPWIKYRSMAKFDSGVIKCYENYMTAMDGEPIRIPEERFWGFMKRFRMMLKTSI